MTQINQIQKPADKKDRKRVGRGGKRGTYSGRGSKGQRARAGHRIRPALRDITKRIPKKRGYRFKAVSDKKSVVNLSSLQKIFDEGAEVNPQILFENSLIKKLKGRLPKVKILAGGEFSKKMIFSGCDISSAALEKIKKAGGKIIEKHEV